MSQDRELFTPFSSRIRHVASVWGVLLVFILPLSLFAQGWSVETNLPTARQKLATCVIGDHIYTIGGATGANQPGLDVNERYDTQTGSWTVRAPMPTPRRELTASVVDGKCYVFGGSAGFQSMALSTLEIYDPAIDQWSSGAAMPTARFYPVSAVIDGIIYVAGGAGTGQIMNDLQAYDPASNSWSVLTPMPTRRAVSAGVALDDKLYVMGGTNAPISQRFDRVEVYDPGTDQWSEVSAMPQTLGALSAETAAGKIFVVGGSLPSQAGVNSVYVYDPMVNSWTPTSSLPDTRALHATAMVGNQLFALGGAGSTAPPHPALSSVLTLTIPDAKQDQPINAGMTDAWFEPATDGQGFFIIVFPELKIIFLAWFTYDTMRPPPDVSAILGEPGHRWLTAQGPYANGVAVLDIINTSGGVFDSPEPSVSNDTQYGIMTIEWQDCEHATLNYDLNAPDVQGSILLQRIVSDRVALCEASATQ